MNKRVLKHVPVALALLALTSCSNDDFLGGNTKSGKKQLIASVEAPTMNDDFTRAAFIPGSNGIIWQTGDQFRVYDAALQKFDEFKCDGEAIFLDGNADVEAYAKAIFPGNQVYYAGWDKASSSAVAVMEIPNTVTYGGVAVNGEKVAYVSALPLWGDATVTEDDNLEVSLAHLGAYTDITVYKGAVKKIRVIAAKEDISETELADVTSDDASLAEYVDAETPLAGYFEAQLVEGGILTPNFENPMTKDSYSCFIEVSVYEGDKGPDEAHIFIPIVPATYQNLLIQSSVDGTTWTDVKAYTEQEVKRNVRISKGLELGDKPQPAIVSSLEDLSKKLEYTSGDEFVKDGDVVDVAVKEDATIATSEDYQTLVLPENKEITINIDGSILNETPNVPLQIVGGTAGKTVTLNIKGGIKGTERIEIKSNCEVVLCGTYESSTSPATTNHNTIQVLTDQKVTLGKNIIAPFNTNMIVLVGENIGALVVDAGNGMVGAIEYTDKAKTNTITVESGTVKVVGGTTAGNGKVTVNGGAVNTLNTNEGDVEVNEDAAVGNITTQKGNVKIDKTSVDKITIKDISSANAEAAPQLSLVGGTGTDAKLAKIGALDIANNKAIWTKSEGKSTILDVANSNKVRFISDWNDKDIATTEIGSAGVIYTAAQLAGLAAGKNYTLRADKINMIAEWTPVNLSGNFVVNTKDAGNSAPEITGLTAPLFGKVSGTSTIGTKDNVLNLKNCNITTDKADQGVLAQVVEGTVTINYIVVDGGTLGANTGKAATKNYGGLVGRAKGTVTFSNNKLANLIVNAYANAGGYVGNFEGSKITITVDNTTTYASNVTFAQTFTPTLGTTDSDANAGTFGLMIGSVTGDGATILINKNKDGVGDVIGHYFSGTIEPSNLNFSNNKKVENGAVVSTFRGMTDHEIGYSPVTSISKESVKYSKLETQLGNPVYFTIEDINVFQ